MVKCPTFYNNPHIIQDRIEEDCVFFPMFLDNPNANYCKQDLPDRAIHRKDAHIIEQCCEVYGIKNPELKCDIFLDPFEIENVENICSSLDKDFVTIEPYSKTNYTPNRSYPFEKFQAIVNAISSKIQVVQIGNTDSKLLSNVIDMRGETSFREATGVIGKSKLFISCEGGLAHAATATDTKALVIITGYQSQRMVAYPQNINVNISNHDVCGLKVECPQCKSDAENHDVNQIIEITQKALGL
jgi:ADP-heptose:LPS heptosyltransferase